MNGIQLYMVHVDGNIVSVIMCKEEYLCGLFTSSRS